MPSTPAGFSGTGDFGSLHSSSSKFRIFLRVLIRACTSNAWLQQSLGNLSFPRRIPAPASSMWLCVLSRESGDREKAAALKHLVPEVEFRRGQNQLGSAQGNSWGIQALPCRSTWFFPAGKMKQAGNSWPLPLQMFGCDGNGSPGMTGIKPQQVVSSELSSGSTSLPGLLLSCLAHPRPTWPDFGEGGGRKRLKVSKSNL